MLRACLIRRRWVRQEELTDTIVGQNETLLDNNKELNKYEVLKVDHETEVQQHQQTTKQLEDSEQRIQELISGLKVL